MKRPSERALEYRRKHQRMQYMVGGGLLLACAVIAVIDHLREDPPLRGTLSEPDQALVRGATTVSLRELPTLDALAALDAEPAEPLDETRREGLKKALLDEVGFVEEVHQHPGPWHELSFEHEDQRLRLLLSTDLERAVVEGPLVSHRYRLQDGDRLRSILEESPR